MDMTVKELIEKLNKADPEAELVFSMADGCCSDREYLELYGADFEEHLQYNIKSELVRPKDFPHGTFEFDFHAPWFLASCRKAGAAKSAAQAVEDSHKKWLEDQKKK
jgi:hypothetical protein